MNTSSGRRPSSLRVSVLVAPLLEAVASGVLPTPETATLHIVLQHHERPGQIRCWPSLEASPLAADASWHPFDPDRSGYPYSNSTSIADR
jgi:hypothetical protein